MVLPVRDYGTVERLIRTLSICISINTGINEMMLITYINSALSFWLQLIKISFFFFFCVPGLNIRCLRLFLIRNSGRSSYEIPWNLEDLRANKANTALPALRRSQPHHFSHRSVITDQTKENACITYQRYHQILLTPQSFLFACALFSAAAFSK